MFLIHISFYLFELQHNYGCEEDELFRSGAAPKMYLIYNSCRYSGMFSNKLVKKSWRIGRCVLKGSFFSSSSSISLSSFLQSDLVQAVFSLNCWRWKVLPRSPYLWSLGSTPEGTRARTAADTQSFSVYVLLEADWSSCVHAQDNE